MKQLIFSASRKDFDIQTFCTGGPGGQNQNRNKNGVRIAHRESGLSATAREFKSQRQNRKAAFQRLAKKLLAWVIGTQERSAMPTETVRTYHAVENRVKDHGSGLVQPYSHVLDDPSDMIKARREALTEPAK